VIAWRALQLVVPLAVACLYLLFAGATAPPRGRTAPYRSAVILLASYVALKGAYNLLLVPLMSQGHWYFPVSIEVTNVIVALGVARLGEAVGAVVETEIALSPSFRSRAIWFLRGTGAAAVLLAPLCGIAFLAKLADGAHSHWKLAAAAGLALVAGILLLTKARPAAEALERLAMNGVGWRVAAAVGAAAFLVVSANAAVNQKVDGHYGDVSYDFWKARREVDAVLASAGADGHVFELDDGIMGYALSAPTMNAFGLSVDREAAESYRRGKCVDVALARGYDVLSSVTYWSYLSEQRAGFVKPETAADVTRALDGSDSYLAHPPCAGGGLAFSFLRSVPIGARYIYFVKFASESSR
jgi:hypothetical protein